jgi:hypothetical protein
MLNFPSPRNIQLLMMFEAAFNIRMDLHRLFVLKSFNPTQQVGKKITGWFSGT